MGTEAQKPERRWARKNPQRTIMNYNSNDLEDVITDAVNDSQFGIEETVPEVEDTHVSEAPDTTEDEPQDAPETAQDGSGDTQVSSPASSGSNEPEAPKDDAEQLDGIPRNGITGRENRIPYSRVKKITEKATHEIAEAALGRKLAPGEKAIDVVKAHVAQIPDLVAKTQDYESRLTAVGKFEEVLTTNPQQFLQELAKIPVYKDFFEFVEKAYTAYESGQFGQPAGQTPVQTPAAAPVAAQVTGGDDDMPQPDETFADGSQGYSMEGIRKLQQWTAANTEKRVLEQFEAREKQLVERFEQRYKPIEEDWQAKRRIEATLPIIRTQIAEARTWPMFNELEPEIVKVLEADKKISLEAAYRKVAFPKIMADRTAMKQNVIQEMRKAPTQSSSVGLRVSTKPNAPTAEGPRNLEDIIADSVANLKR